MRQALTEFQQKIDTDLEAIEAGILDYLRQAERLFSDKAKAQSDVKLRIAQACRTSLVEFRAMRNRLIAKRQLMENIQPN